ncbi:hypothetical protein SAMN05720354_10788 [Nitrosospira sp. Nsp1]|nr:hypothetical protein SAMN05720354_10788 [Nitrosospira sp. Nsp1]
MTVSRGKVFHLALIDNNRDGSTIFIDPSYERDAHQVLEFRHLTWLVMLTACEANSALIDRYIFQFKALIITPVLMPPACLTRISYALAGTRTDESHKTIT